MLRRFGRVAVVSSLFVGFAVGCGGDDEGGGANGGGNAAGVVEEELTLASDARVIDVELRDDALISADEEADQYVFDAAALEAEGLEITDGTVLLIAEQALIRVASTSLAGGELTVTGSDAALPDLVESGRLAWDLDLDSDIVPTPKAFIGDKELRPKQNGDDGDSIDFSTEVDGFNITVSVTPNSAARRLEVEIIIDRETGGGQYRAVATGRVGYFRHISETVIDGGATDDWSFTTDDLAFDIRLQAAGANVDVASTTLVLPGPFQLRFPIPTALPLGLNVAVTFNLLAEVELPQFISASTQFDARFRYGGGAGFEGSAGGFETTGTNSSGSLEVSDPNTAATMGGAGFTFALSAPRIALNALADQTSARLDNIYSAAGSITGTVLTGLCIESGARHRINGTVTASFFGLELGELTHTFYNDEEFLARGDTCSGS